MVFKLMKKFVGLALILMLTLLPAAPLEKAGKDLAGNDVQGYKCAVPSGDGFTPENMSIGDDSFHSNLPLHAETWYFEGIFSNGYSMVFIITLLSSDGNAGIALEGLYIYSSGHLKIMERKLSFSFNASDEKPLIKISGSTVMEGFIDRSGNLFYNISFESGENGIELHFINQTEGWQGEMGAGWWLAVPGLHVTGKMKLNGDEISVEGKGYHDHNIFSLLTPLTERGYADGKIMHGTTSIVWGYIMHGMRNADVFAILSENGSYIAISPGSMEIKFSSYIYDHGRKIPTEVFISINDTKNAIFAELHVTSIGFHHIRLPFLRYWRYHVRTEGKIRIGECDEDIDEIDIMERMLY